MKKPLEEFRKDAYEFTGKLSDVNRYLALTGIAIIWIFREKNEELIKIPSDLWWPSILIITSLSFDLLQYFYLATIWTCFHKCKENKGVSLKKKVAAPKWYPIPSYVLLFLKVILNIIGYTLLLCYLFRELS